MKISVKQLVSDKDLGARGQASESQDELLNIHTDPAQRAPSSQRKHLFKSVKEDSDLKGEPLSRVLKHESALRAQLFRMEPHLAHAGSSETCLSFWERKNPKPTPYVNTITLVEEIWVSPRGEASPGVYQVYTHPDILTSATFENLVDAENYIRELKGGDTFVNKIAACQPEHTCGEKADCPECMDSGLREWLSAQESPIDPEAEHKDWLARHASSTEESKNDMDPEEIDWLETLAQQIEDARDMGYLDK